MARFYSLVRRTHHEPFDPERAAALEVDWWRVHREHQRGDGAVQEQSLIEALAALYAYVYDTKREDVLIAARERALAMRYSDQWVAHGCERLSPLVSQERAALVRSYAALLAAVHRPHPGQ
jgi:hypothetical protein